MRQIWSFSKVSSKTDFNEYKKLFQFIIPDCDLKKLKEEFEHYLLEELPETDNFDIKYWCSLPLSYPLLSKIALIDIDSIKKYSLLYFNGDIESVFDNY